MNFTIWRSWRNTIIRVALERAFPFVAASVTLIFAFWPAISRSETAPVASETAPVAVDGGTAPSEPAPAPQEDAPPVQTAVPPPLPAAAAAPNSIGILGSDAVYPVEEEHKPFDLHRFVEESTVGVWMQSQRITFGGYFVQSFTGNFDSPSDHFNGPVTWTDRSNEYQLNEKSGFVQRISDTTQGCDWDWGGRCDIFTGTNARFFTSSGDERDFNKTAAFYGLNLPQLYGEIAYRKVKLKVGHYYSPAGFFTVNTALNFFSSIPYTYQYGEPFTHTGGLATWTATDALSFSGGVTRGWNNSGNFNPHLGGIGAVTYRFNDQQDLSFVVTFGKEPSRAGAGGEFSSRYLQSLVYSHKLSCCWNYVLQSDFATQSNATATGDTARWYGINQYLFYEQNAKLTWGIGGEWFRDEAGFRVGGMLPLPATGPGVLTRGLSPARNGYAGSFFETTMGPRWAVNRYIIVRPNLRFDWFAGDVLNAGNLKPFDNGNKNSQTLLGTDVILNY